MALNLTDPDDHELRAHITVFGVGGAGGNAVNNMIEKQLAGVEFITANTDAQALAHSRAPRSIQLGSGVTRGLGAGSKPEVGLSAAEDSIEEIAAHLDGCHMCFITAGMGGGTGTGAAPIVARTAREMGILTVGVVTKPFSFEGNRRMAIAEAGVSAMQDVVDTLIVIPNQNLFQVASERTTFVEAFMMADDVLYQGVQGVTDLMVRPGMINLDFADVRSVMEEMGKAMMGTGEAEGDTRAVDAAEKAIANPLLDEVSLKGAKGVLINITGGYDLTLFEMDEAANRIKDEVDPEALIKFGSAIDPDMEGKMRVSVVATGIDAEMARARPPQHRRRPAETDPGIVSAVRGGRPAVEPEPVAVVEMPEHDAGSDPVEEIAQPIGAGTSSASSVGATAPAAESVPEAAEPISEERRFATTPAPSDIRARADEVRARAMAARAQRQVDEEVRAQAFAEEPALFDLDENSLDTPAAPVLADPGSAKPQLNDPFSGPASASAGRGGLFTINKLINRVAGNGHPDSRPARAGGVEPQAPALDEDRDHDIPAFLRRQAN